MRHLTLREYQTTSAVPLSSHERAGLVDLVPSLTIAPHPYLSECFDLTPGSWVGGATLGSLAVEIRPKIPIDRLLFLISYSLHRLRWRESPFLSTHHPSLVEAIAVGFLAHARRVLARGVLRGYRHHDETLNTIRGRIRFDDQIRDRYGLFPPIEVGFDEFTDDIEENRLLKAAATRLGRLRLRSEVLRRGLLAVEGALQHVQSVHYDRRLLPAIRYTRLNEHYRPAVELSKLILRSSSYETRHGGIHAWALLVDMNQVFEDFVVLALRDELRLPPSAFPHQAEGRKLRLDRAGTIPLYPDFSRWDGPRCTFVGDVKYKRTRNNDAVNADLYQLLAYTVAANLPRGLLVYAAGEAPPDAHEVVHLETALDIVTLDLQRPPEQILSQIAVIADHIRSTC